MGTKGGWEWFVCAQGVSGNAELASWLTSQGLTPTDESVVQGGRKRNGKPVSLYSVPESLVMELFLLGESFPSHKIRLYRRRKGELWFDECRFLFRRDAVRALQNAL